MIGGTAQGLQVRNYIYDTGTLAWIAEQQPLVKTDTLTVTIGTPSVHVLKDALTASSPTATTVAASSGVAVAANANRTGLLLVNTSANYISLGFGAAAVLYSGITLNPSGGCFWMDSYSFSTAAVYAIASAGSSNMAVQEYQ